MPDHLPYGPVNVEMFQKVKHYILEHPNHFRMDGWLVNEFCGTVGCIAGLAVALDKGLDLEHHMPDTSGWVEESIITMAAKLFGLSEGVSNKVFYFSDWPRGFRDEYVRTRDVSSAAARVAADYIDWICGCLEPKRFEELYFVKD